MARVHISANATTLAGLLLSMLGAVLLGQAHLGWSAVALITGSLLDVLDGPLARRRGMAGPRGALLDTFADRLGEASLWAGMAYWAVPNQLDVLLAISCLGLSSLIPFLRARAEAVGLSGKGGLMGRAERLILFCGGVTLAALGVDVLRGMMVVMAVLSGLTVAQRYRSLFQQLPSAGE